MKIIELMMHDKNCLEVITGDAFVYQHKHMIYVIYVIINIMANGKVLAVRHESKNGFGLPFLLHQDYRFIKSWELCEYARL